MIRATFSESSRLSEAKWWQRYQEGVQLRDKKALKIREQVGEIESLIVGSSPLLVFLLFLTGI